MNYLMNQIIPLIRQILDSRGLGQQKPHLYNAFLSELSNGNSQTVTNLVGSLDQNTRGMWRNGSIDQNNLVNILRNWMNQILPMIDSQLQAQMGYQQQNMGYQQSPMMGYQPQQQMNMGDIYTAQQPAPQMYNVSSEKPQVQDIEPLRQEPNIMNFDEGSVPNIKLERRDKELPPSFHGMIRQIYQTENAIPYKSSMSSSGYTLKGVENNSADALNRFIKLANLHIPSNELFVNFLEFKEIVCIPFNTKEFQRIVNRILKEMECKKDKPYDTRWRHALDAMGILSRSEWKTIETMILSFINPLLYRIMRSDRGDYISSVTELDDILSLVDPRAKYPIADCPNYLATIDGIANKAFNIVLNANNLLTPTLKNAGAIIKCDKLEYYQNGRTKYDYGSIPDVNEQLTFLEKILDEHTLLLVDKSIVYTNAIDHTIVNIVQNYDRKNYMRLDSIKNTGFELFKNSLIYSHSQIPGVIEKIDSVYCLERNQNKVNEKDAINFGYTLEGGFVLLS